MEREKDLAPARRMSCVPAPGLACCLYHGLLRYGFSAAEAREFADPPRVQQTPKARIPTDLRWAVWERDDFRCQHCGARRRLAVDHILPESRGGGTDFDNLQTLCGPCNSRKGASL